MGGASEHRFDVFFAGLMFISGYRMIKSAQIIVFDRTNKFPLYIMILQGALLGLITGGVGAGGGFLIIPALVNYYGMPITYAVATSLAIISLNSFFGLAGDLEKLPLFDWNILVPYTLILIVGMFMGFYIQKYFRGNQLKKSLGYLILAIGGFILVQELLQIL